MDTLNTLLEQLKHETLDLEGCYRLQALLREAYPDPPRGPVDRAQQVILTLIRGAVRVRIATLEHERACTP